MGGSDGVDAGVDCSQAARPQLTVKCASGKKFLISS